jgi:hypothetical protein
MRAASKDFPAKGLVAINMQQIKSIGHTGSVDNNPAFQQPELPRKHNFPANIVNRDFGMR